MRRDMSSSQPGREQRLTLRPSPADKGDMAVARAPRDERAFHARARERGQAMVEFALIAPLFIMLVAGIIQFGVVLNFWLDMQRISNQGARWAVVNAYPGCPRTGPLTPACPAPGGSGYASLLQYELANERLAAGEVITPYICFGANTGPGGTPTVGDPVTVRMSRSFTLVPIVNVGSIDLRASATMRLEQKPTRYVADGPSSC